jgi:hypothetical protein
LTAVFQRVRSFDVQFEGENCDHVYTLCAHSIIPPLPIVESGSVRFETYVHPRTCDGNHRAPSIVQPLASSAIEPYTRALPGAS